MSPYIVTTKRRAHPEPRPEGAVMLTVSRVAVATLNDAARLADIERLNRVDTVPEFRAVLVQIKALPESGGTITLTDGTVIEVEQTTWAHLWSYTALVPDTHVLAERGDAKAQQRILDAFNA